MISLNTQAAYTLDNYEMKHYFGFTFYSWKRFSNLIFFLTYLDKALFFFCVPFDRESKMLYNCHHVHD